MFGAAALVVVAGGAVRMLSAVPAPLSEPQVLAAAVALAWLLWGPPWGLAIATIAWSILNIGWTLQDRLHPALVGQDIMVRGTICDFPRDDGRARRFVLHVARSPTDPPLPARVYLGSYGAIAGDLAGGQQWRLKVRLKRPRGLSNPGAFDFERWSLERRIGATGYVRVSPLNRRVALGSGACPTMRARQSLATAIERAADADGPVRFVLALAVGARHRLTEDDWTVLRRTGTVHLMAISGLHIGLVAGMLLFVGRALGYAALLCGFRCSPRSVGRALALGGAAGYAALAGFAVPTMRALVMVFAAVALTSRRRLMSAWHSLGAAALAVSWVDPLAMLGSGFWLSFGAVSVLMLTGLSLSTEPPAGEPLPGRLGARFRLLVMVQLTLSAGLTPLSMLFFGEASLVAPLTNLFAIPLFALAVVPLTLVGSLALPVAPLVAGVVLEVATAVLGGALDLLGWIAAWRGSAWRGAPPGGLWIAMACPAALLVIWPRPLRGRIPLALVLLAVAWASAQRAPPTLRVVVMDVGQGLAVLVQTREHALLYDAGPAFGRRDAGQTVVLPVLNHFGVGALDAIVVSHGDNDHAGGVESVLAEHPDAALIALAPPRTARRRVAACRAGMQWRWDDVRFRVLHPDGDGALATDNERSCVLSIATRHGSLLLPGDIERRAELRLLRKNGLGRHDLVVAPHHGSATSSSPPFVRAVRPRFVVFATGFANRWKFPDRRVSDRWRRVGACLLNTAVDGATVFEVTADQGMHLIARHRYSGRRVWTERAPSAERCPPEAPTNYSGARL